MEDIKEPKILLGLLPYWDPLIPPVGIATLKGFLQKHGYQVKTIDVILEKVFQDIYSEYFLKMEEYIPESNRGNFYNMGHNALKDHMMAHINYEEKNEYKDFVKLILYETFRVQIDDNQANTLNNIIQRFFVELENYFVEKLETEKPDVLGLSVYKGTLPSSMFVFRLAKIRFPGILTVMGGSVFSTSLVKGTPDYQAVLERTKSYIDKIIIGEGEKLFLKLLRNELPESQRIFSIKEMGMEGLDLADAVLADYSDFDSRNYPYMAATGSVSCPYHCSFCNSAVYWGKYRKKDTGQIVDEMTELYERYGNQLFYMSDALINPIVTDLAREFIKRDISLYYDCFHRVDKKTCEIKNTLLWKQGGLYRVRLGVESGSQRVLDMMKKKITLDQTRAALSALAYAGIKTTTYWVIGHPGETEEDFQKTLDMMTELRNDLYQAEPTPLEYDYEGQSDSEEWSAKRIPQYPKEKAENMLIYNNWVLDCDPTRDVILDRIFRFDELRRQLGIPNPYSLKEHFEADERWGKLHKNAVPPLLKFYNRESYVKESRDSQEVYFAPQRETEDGDFDF
jgi:hypothetical protein